MTLYINRVRPTFWLDGHKKLSKLRHALLPLQTEWDLQKEEKRLFSNLTSSQLAMELQRQNHTDSIGAAAQGHDMLRYQQYALLGGRPAIAPYHVQFDCAKIPEVCENMCFGIICLGDTPRYELHKSNPLNLCRKARSQNRCGKKDTDGFQANGKPAKFNYCS